MKKRHYADEETCFGCNDLLRECKCGDTETYNNDEGPVCPYCGHLNKACDSDGYLYNESLIEWDCGECGRLFSVSVAMSFAWSCKRFGDD